MTKEDYISTLRRALHTLPEADIADIAQDFEEHFAIGLSQGKTEHEISAELGDPALVAATYFDEGLEDIGHTMKESAAHAAAAAAAASSASSAAKSYSGAPAASGSPAAYAGNGTQQVVSTQKDLTGARLFVILLNILLTWWVAITILSTLFSFWCISISLLVAGISAFAALAAASGEWAAVLVLSGVAGILLAVATGILNFFLSKWTVIGIKAYIKWNKKLYNEGF